MPRIARIVIPGLPHHIIQRGNRRQQVFFTDEDREVYLRLVSIFTKKENINVWAYSLMDNHTHLVVVPSTKDCLAKAFGEIHKLYAKRINSRNDWKGHLWQERFISVPMDNAHTMTTVRYVEKNAVRAGIVSKAEDYKWSSAKAHIYGLKDPLLSGDNAIKAEIGDWKSYLRESNDKETLERIRDCSKSGLPLGDDSFIDHLEKITGRILRKKKRGPKR